ncbi:MAG: hypothetical protein GZ088_15695 [Acidipila sp.]|nr:hypothetical protein [Acidipila sp.]
MPRVSEWVKCRDSSLRWAGHAVARLWLLAACAVFAVPVRAAELRPETIAAFDRYIVANDVRFERESKHGPFLWVEGQPPENRKALYEQLRRGETVINRVPVEIGGEALDVPDGIIHHWVGVVFIPGATLRQTLRLLQDYDNHAKYYAPDVKRSKLLEHKGNFFRCYLRFYKKKVFAVVLDTEHEAVYETLSAVRAVSHSHTTRVNEVENYGQADERLKPEGQDGGFLWKLNTYWRIEQKDGGVYLQCEGITLTRDIPLLVKPLIGPYVTSVPRESLLNTLGNTRKALLHPTAAP